jgi:hypothetical protein
MNTVDCLKGCEAEMAVDGRHFDMDIRAYSEGDRYGCRKMSFECKQMYSLSKFEVLATMSMNVRASSAGCDLVCCIV